MAISKKIKGITIQFNGDTTNLGKALGNVESTVVSTESELRKVNKALKDIDPNNTVLLAQKQDILNEAIEASKKKLKGLEDAQEQVEKQFKSGDIGADAYREFQRTIEATKKKLNGLETESDELKKAQREMANNGADFAKEKIEGVGKAAKTEGKKINDLGDDFKNAEKDARNFGGGIDAAQVALGSLAADGIKGLGSALKDYAADSQTASNSFAAQTGATAEEMQKYSGVIDDLYKNSFGESKNDVANAMALVKQTVGDVDADKLKEMTENAMTLSDTFGFDVSEQLRAVNMLTKQFGVSSDEAYNLIVQGAQKGLNKNGDLLDTINEYAVHYKQLGYTSDEFFNSLANGTASGTFSVDKLGDAMKEFGIRSKDTAKTTTDALALLGYSSGAADEEVAKVTDEVAKLEKNLKYAKLEQENFNNKTSELTRLKNAEKIKEYSKSLDTAKKKLQALKDSSDSSGESISDLQTRFAAGGETAKKATDEVLEKLFSMDDQVAQNAAGVGLFGTMWEDLGKNGVEALMNTNGEIDKTEEALQKVKDVKYDDITTEITGLGREFQEEILKPVIEDFMPDIKNGMKWLKDNLKGITPVIKGVGTAVGVTFATKKIAGFISGIKTTITTIKTLSAAAKAAETTQLALNAAQSASPVGLVCGAIGLLVGGLVTLNEAMKDSESETNKLKGSQQELYDEIDKNRQAWDDMKKSRHENATNIESEYGYYDSLCTELQNITDENGKIKQGYEDRATVIASTLSEALGTEIEINNGVVLKYQEVVKEIGNVIAAEKAKAMQSAYGESYNAAITSQTEDWNNYQAAYENYFTTLGSLANFRAELKELEKERYRKIQTSTGLQYAHIDPNDAVILRYNTLSQTVKNMEVQLQTSYKKYQDAQQTYLDDVSTIQNYENLSAAITSGNADKINDATNKMVNNFITAENGTKISLKNQLDDMEKHYNELKTAVENGAPGVTQKMVDNAKEMFDLAAKEYAKKDNPVLFAAENVGGATVAQFKEGAFKKEDDLKNGLTNTAKRAISDAGVNLRDDAVVLGSDLMDGIIEGLMDRRKNEQSVATVAQWTVDGFKDRWQINSPSKVGRSLGGYFVKGLELGFGDGKNNMLKTVNTVGTDTISTLKSQLDNLPTVNLNSRYTAAVKSGNITPALSGSRMFNITIGEFVNNTDRDIDTLAQQISVKLNNQMNQMQRGMGW